MRVLVLSANTGAGHNTAARALEEQMQKNNIECHVWDALSFISETASRLVSEGHTQFYRHFPKLFGLIYRFEEKHSNKWLYDLCAKGAEAMHERLLTEPFDAIICTHTFSAMMLTAFRRRYEDRTPAYFVATDYTASPGVSDSDLDMYFVPHRMLFAEFIRCGIAADRMVASGIPICEKFYRPLSKVGAREALQLPREGKMVLLSGGSMGAGNLDRAALHLIDSLPNDAYLVVICGQNEKTYRALLPHACERLYVLGFTDQIDAYMSAADLYITKPGGLTTSEAIAKRTPMLFVNAVPGCETRNYDFLIRSGVAAGAMSWKDAVDKTYTMLSKPALLEEQVAAMERFSEQRATEIICRHLQKEIRPLTVLNG